MKNLLVLLVAITVLSTGCRKKDDSSSGPAIVPLTDAQKTDFASTMTNLQDVRDQSQQAPTTSSLTGLTAGSVPTGPIRDAIKSRCTLNVTGYGAPASSTGIDIKVSATGDNCPVILDYSVQATSSKADANNMSVDLKYAAKYLLKDNETDLKAARDIDRFDLNGTFSMKTTGTTSTAGTIVLTGAGGGSFHSQKKGDIRTEHSANVTLTIADKKVTGGGDMKYIITFPTYVVELKATYSSDGTKATAKYFLNGTEISAAEYNTYSKTMTTPDATIPIQ